MKKFVLIAGAAALVLPTASYAKTVYKTDTATSHTTTYHKADSSWNSDHMDNSYRDSNGYRVEVQSEDDFRAGPKAVTNYVTPEGDKLTIDGTSVYKSAANSNARFYAPNGSYVVRGGQTIVVEDGQLKRIEKPAEVVMMDAYNNHR